LPRNFGVPDTSIAGRTSEISNSLPARTAQEQRTGALSGERSSVSITEGEAQKSQPVPAKKTLRARRWQKAAIKLTPSAISHLKALLDQPEPKLIRIGTQAKGCSGLQYHLEYVNEQAKTDEA
jgi:iron-sulfur cluster assembly protein